MEINNLRQVKVAEWWPGADLRMAKWRHLTLDLSAQSDTWVIPGILSLVWLVTFCNMPGGWTCHFASMAGIKNQTWFFRRFVYIYN